MGENIDSLYPESASAHDAAGSQMDKAAIAEILETYEPYIIAQSIVKYTNSAGETAEIIDRDMAQSLRLALIEEISNFRANP